MRPNEFYFDKEDVEKGLAKDFVNYLMDLSIKLENQFLDIRVVNEDLGAIVIYFFVRSWDSEIDYDRFDYVDENRLVVERVDFPDGHYDYFEDSDTKKEVIDSFLKEHPDYEYSYEYHYFKKKKGE